MYVLFNIKAKLVEANLLNEYISPNTVLGISHYNWQLLSITRYYKRILKSSKIQTTTKQKQWINKRWSKIIKQQQQTNNQTEKTNTKIKKTKQNISK